MQDPASVSIGNRSTDRCQHFGRHSRWQGAVGQSFCQRRALDQLHAEKRSTLEFTDFVNVDDVGMVQLGGGFGFGSKPRDISRRSIVAPQDHFQRDDSIKAFLTSTINDAHPTATEFTQQFVVTAVAGCFRRFAGIISFPRIVAVKQIGKAGKVFSDLHRGPEFAQFDRQFRVFADHRFQGFRTATTR